MKTLRTVFGMCVVILWCCGCPRGPTLGDVSGVVTLDGQPVSGVLIVFQPAIGRPSMAETNAKGHFTLGYTGSRNGALTGPMEVSLQPILGGGELDMAKAAAKKFPPKYLTPFQTVEIVAGKNEFTFELTRDKAEGR